MQVTNTKQGLYSDSQQFNSDSGEYVLKVEGGKNVPLKTELHQPEGKKLVLMVLVRGCWMERHSKQAP